MDHSIPRFLTEEVHSESQAADAATKIAHLAWKEKKGGDDEYISNVRKSLEVLKSGGGGGDTDYSSMF